MAENLDNFKKAYGNEIFDEGPSNIESLLGKDELSVQYASAT